MSVSGFLNIDKPLGLTSHDVVAQLRRSAKTAGLGRLKIGHAGTLDPLATGVLVICVGDAARLSEYIMHGTKEYRARVHLGVETDTYDGEGQVIAERDASTVTRAQVEAALATFTGQIEQLPPMYSAVKRAGRKLYDLARAGKVVERTARIVHIASLAILAWEPPFVTLAVTCSAGTYIRSLAHDLGAALGVGASLAGLVRMRSGVFRLQDAIPLDEALASAWWTRLISPAEALADHPRVIVTAEEARSLRHGRAISRAEVQPVTPGVSFAFDADWRLVAVLIGEAGGWKPVKVFPAGG